jgi:hypothetical protein
MNLGSKNSNLAFKRTLLISLKWLPSDIYLDLNSKMNSQEDLNDPKIDELQ